MRYHDKNKKISGDLSSLFSLLFGAFYFRILLLLDIGRMSDPGIREGVDEKMSLKYIKALLLSFFREPKVHLKMPIDQF